MKLYTTARPMEKMTDGEICHGTYTRNTDVVTDHAGIIRWKSTNVVVPTGMLEDNGITPPKSQFNAFVEMCKRYAEWCALVKPMPGMDAGGDYVMFMGVIMGSDVHRATIDDATPSSFSKFLAAK